MPDFSSVDPEQNPKTGESGVHKTRKKNVSYKTRHVLVLETARCLTLLCETAIRLAFGKAQVKIILELREAVQ